jgi:hypothetical protein
VLGCPAIRLTVNGAALTDAAGNPLGGDFATTLRRRNR